MAYITEKMRNELRMQQFRDALSGKHKKPEPEETLKDHGVNDPLSEGDIEGLGRFYKREIAQEQRAEEELISGKPAEEDALQREESGLMARVLAGGPVRTCQPGAGPLFPGRRQPCRLKRPITREKKAMSALISTRRPSTPVTMPIRTPVTSMPFR
jgi:hypothetical protein